MGDNVQLFNLPYIEFNFTFINTDYLPDFNYKLYLNDINNFINNNINIFEIFAKKFNLNLNYLNFYTDDNDNNTNTDDTDSKINSPNSDKKNYRLIDLLNFKNILNINQNNIKIKINCYILNHLQINNFHLYQSLNNDSTFLRFYSLNNSNNYLDNQNQFQDYNQNTITLRFLNKFNNTSLDLSNSSSHSLSNPASNISFNPTSFNKYLPISSPDLNLSFKTDNKKPISFSLNLIIQYYFKYLFVITNYSNSLTNLQNLSSPSSLNSTDPSVLVFKKRYKKFLHFIRQNFKFFKIYYKFNCILILDNNFNEIDHQSSISTINRITSKNLSSFSNLEIYPIEFNESYTLYDNKQVYNSNDYVIKNSQKIKSFLKLQNSNLRSQKKFSSILNKKVFDSNYSNFINKPNKNYTTTTTTTNNNNKPMSKNKNFLVKNSFDILNSFNNTTQPNGTSKRRSSKNNNENTSDQKPNPTQKNSWEFINLINDILSNNNGSSSKNFDDVGIIPHPIIDIPLKNINYQIQLSQKIQKVQVAL
ncbi:uncharacterized protein ASCRUDRAFT_68895 [Ascoidea rubescens DSM 1968]|uniref:Uncharacterized protein n=1 Tax=Ascoidea rubescens DSM 1968 TaxID=1344418 RepID=A0A1D2VNG2_9ASCO|nr:hypothetical protein ASCRUDRAFT_68895 [Ascoidea rubescens DSM 1968]ODV63124.1 hypothetical protein ASCRUDRAFT_68895 [Ascoidea rubescens DSM 1968]